jgi:hypothetical protein
VSTTLIQPGSEFKLCWEALVQSCCSLRDGGKRKRDRTPTLPKRRKTVGGPQARFASLCDGLRPSWILVANSGAEPDQATICRAANCEMRVFAEGVSLCHSATLTRLTATAVMTCCKRVFANPM